MGGYVDDINIVPHQEVYDREYFFSMPIYNAGLSAWTSLALAAALIFGIIFLLRKA